VPNKFYASLPRSMRGKNVVTAVRDDEDMDKEELEERRAAVKNYTPAQLAQFSGIGDFPIPSRISGAFSSKKKRGDSKKRSRSETSVNGETPAGWYGTLPKSLREAKVVTKVKEADADDQVIQERRKLVESTTPSQLAAIHGPGDMPWPTLFKSRSRSGSLAKRKRKYVTLLMTFLRYVGEGFKLFLFNVVTQIQRCFKVCFEGGELASNAATVVAGDEASYKG
jgi:hypothetical protein